jgi:hypothetical protein
MGQPIVSIIRAAPQADLRAVLAAAKYLLGLMRLRQLWGSAPAPLRALAA